MNKESTSQFWFKPGGFWRHQKTCIRNRKKFSDGSRIHGKSHLCIFTTTFFQFFCSPDTTHKINAWICLWICNSENRLQQLIVKKRNIQSFHRIRIQIFRTNLTGIPLSFQIHGKGTFLLWMFICLIQLRYIKQFLHFY